MSLYVLCNLCTFAFPDISKSGYTSRMQKPNGYPDSFSKKYLDLTLALGGIIFLSPIFLFFGIILKLINNGPIFFFQKRVGKDGRVFNFIKFRTMRVTAEQERAKYMHLNEADGPVFKIRDDPRFVGIGKFLANTGLDELPQLINVIKGEMSLVGPRPLPVSEANKLTKAQKVRELVKPGITSSWVISGAHNLKFEEWMRLDKGYVENASFSKDLEILLKTAEIVLKQILKQTTKKWG